MINKERTYGIMLRRRFILSFVTILVLLSFYFNPLIAVAKEKDKGQ